MGWHESGREPAPPTPRAHNLSPSTPPPPRAPFSSCPAGACITGVAVGWLKQNYGYNGVCVPPGGTHWPHNTQTHSTPRLARSVSRVL